MKTDRPSPSHAVQVMLYIYAVRRLCPSTEVWPSTAWWSTMTTGWTSLRRRWTEHSSSSYPPRSCGGRGVARGEGPECNRVPVCSIAATDCPERVGHESSGEGVMDSSVPRLDRREYNLL